MSQSRRTFIKVSTLATATLFPAVRSIAKTLGSDEDEVEELVSASFNEALEFQLLGNNLLNLHFYFINTERIRQRIRAKDCSRKSFMIIRLPQQHVSERAFSDKDLRDGVKPASDLSGFSFLTFQLWPTYDHDRCNPRKRRTIPFMDFNMSVLLDWNNRKNFKLITLTDWFQLNAKTEMDFVGCSDIGKKEIVQHSDLDLQERVEDGFEPKSLVYRKFRRIVAQLIYGGPVASGFIPVSLFEVPNKLFIVPFTRAVAGKDKISVKFFTNQQVAAKAETGSRKYEVWNNTLQFRRTSLSKEANEEGKFVIERPNFRAVGFSKGKYDSGLPALCRYNEPPGCPPNGAPANGFHPSLLTRMELAYLTQYAKEGSNDFTGEEFDIREQNGFFFTGLGVITHLKYYNIHNIPPKIDLIEYEHIINLGRDVFIKVARIGVNSKTGQRYKHVFEAKRKIHEDSGKDYSYLELKQYCECIEPVKNFGLPAGDIWQSNTFRKPSGFLTNANPLFLPVQTNEPHYRRFPFKMIEVREKERIPIEPYKDDAQGRQIHIPNPETAEWFWPIHEGTSADPKYLLCEIKGEDLDNGLLATSTPFMFIRKCVIEGNDSASLAAIYNSYFGFNDIESSARNNRRKIFLNRRLSFTPPFPQQGDKNESHTIETEYVEMYFNIKIIQTGETFNKTAYPVLPQLLQSKSYLEHISELTGKRLASYVDYHSNYITSAFGDGNYGKQILKHTPAFIDETVSFLREPRYKIKNALHEAKNQLGNIATPDIIPETVSVSKFGITLPLTPTFENSLAAASDPGRLLKPFEFLQKNSDLIGFDLKSLLQEFIPENNIPLFQISKVANEIEAVRNNPIYNEIINFTIPDPLNPNERLSPQALISRYENLLQEIREAIKEGEMTIRSLLNRLSHYIPNSDQLKDLIKKLFEHYRLEAFTIDTEKIGFSGNDAYLNSLVSGTNAFFATEKKALIDDYRQVLADLRTMKGDLIQELARVPIPTRLQTISGLSLAQFMEDRLIVRYQTATNTFFDYSNRINDIFQPVAEAVHLSIGPKKVYFKLEGDRMTWEITEASSGKPFMIFRAADVSKVNYVQLEHKIEGIRKFIAANQNITGLKADVVTALRNLIAATVPNNYTTAFATLKNSVSHFQSQLELSVREIEGWRKEYEEYLNDTPTADLAMKTVLAKINSMFVKCVPHLDLLRKVDPFYYYAEQKRLRKEIVDIRRRFIEHGGGLDLEQIYETEIKSKVKEKFDQYLQLITNYSTNVIQLKNFAIERSKLLNGLEDIGKRAFDIVTTHPAYAGVKDIYDEIDRQKNLVEDKKRELQRIFTTYTQILESQASSIKDNIEGRVVAYIAQLEADMVNAVGEETIRKIEDSIREAKNIYKLLTSIKQQDVNYTWNTTQFKDFNLGIVSFKTSSNPPTELKVDVRATTHFTAGKFPPTIDKITSRAENRITNFSVGFFSVLTVGFSEVSFSSGNGGSDFNVKIKDVKFDGALSFVQAFEKYLTTIGKGLILRLESDHVALGYSMPIPSVQTPAFSFFNLSLNFDIRIHFDKRPMRFGFSLARPEAKFGITAGIYAGFGFFTLVGEPKKGIVEIDVALEAGAWAGIRIGPISGEVKLAFGFRYTKTEFMVRLEGYVVAEGRLTVWILEVSARIYLGIISENSYVEGRCTVSYSVKLGFLKKRFSGSFYKKIAGAKSANGGPQRVQLAHILERRLQLFAADPSFPYRVGREFNAETLSRNLVLTQQQEVYETYTVENDDFESFFKQI